MTDIMDIIKSFIEKNPNLGYISNPNSIISTNVKEELKKIDNNELINVLAAIIAEINNEEKKKQNRINILKEYEFEKYIPLDKMEQIIKFMYYEYEIRTTDFMNLCQKALDVNPDENFARYLINNDIVKLLDVDRLSLSTAGINLGARLGFTSGDKDKEEYVYKIKKKIGS